MSVAVLTFARMNPPHIGHGLLIREAMRVAECYGVIPHIVISHKVDTKTNPLHAHQRASYIELMFPGTPLSVSDSINPSFLHQAQKLFKEGVTDLHVVVGSDRVTNITYKLDFYNGDDVGDLFNFKTIQVHSCGERDSFPFSSTAMRQAALYNNFKTFRAHIPDHVSIGVCQDMFEDVKDGLKK